MRFFLHKDGVGRRPGLCALGTLLLACLASAVPAIASDTIVLKNGRRIVALSAVEDGDKVRYQTEAGELSLPKSMVDHIERGTAGPMPESRAASAANMGITPPSMEASAEIEKAAVHDGSIDRNYLARVEGEARSGDATASERAAQALHAASQFELGHGDLEHALADERTALTFTPDNPVILMNVAYLHLK